MKYFRELIVRVFTFALLLYAFTAAGASANAMTFSHGGATEACRDPEACAFWVEAAGEIEENSDQKLIAYIRNSGYPYQTIRFNSPGGSVIGGVKLGAWLRKAGFSTQATFCASACVYSFLGGVERMLIGKNPRIGVHRFYNEQALLRPTLKQYSGEDLDSTQRIMAGLMLYVQQMGGDLRLIALTAEAGPSSMRWLTREEANDLRVTYQSKQWMPWGVTLQKNGGGIIATSKTQDASGVMQIACSRGKRYFSVISTGIEEEWANQCRESADMHPVLGVLIPAQNMRIIKKSNAGAAGVQFTLPNGALNYGSPAVFSWRDTSTYPMACVDVNESLAGTSEGLAQTARLALKNCLD